jgi:hypothetical protein
VNRDDSPAACQLFLALADKPKQIRSAGQVEWMNRMEQEHDNLRAALEWSKTAEGAAETCLRLAGALGLFWEVRGYLSEGRERLAAILSTDLAQGRTAAHANLLARAAELAYRQSDYPATTSYAGESLVIYRCLGTSKGLHLHLSNLEMQRQRWRLSDGISVLEEALMTWRDLEDKHGTAVHSLV